MNKAVTRYLAFPFSKSAYVLVIGSDYWVWFYDIYIEHPDDIEEVNLDNGKPLFVIPIDDLKFLEGSVYLDKNIFSALPATNDTQTEIFFDQKSNCFKAQGNKKNSLEPRLASIHESLMYCDIIATQGISLDELKLRLLETYLGFIPSFQYNIEHVYQTFYEPYRQSLIDNNETFSVPARKKAFDKIHKEKIVPFLLEYGFKKHTKSSKRLVKELENGLSVFIFFEHKTFGQGHYEASIVYFDSDFGNVYDDNWFVIVKGYFPYSSNLMMDSQNSEILNFDVDFWLRNMAIYILPFIEKNTNHKNILTTIECKETLDLKRAELGIDKHARRASYYFEFPLSSRKEACLKILEQKGNAFKN